MAASSLCLAAKPRSLGCVLLETLWGISQLFKGKRSFSAKRLARILSPPGFLHQCEMAVSFFLGMPVCFGSMVG